MEKDNKQFKPITEGFIKKGGLNPKATTQRPPAPAAHKPKPSNKSSTIYGNGSRDSF